MTITAVLLAIAILGLLAALVGIIIPGLPGIPILWVLVAIDFFFTGYLELGTGIFLILTALAALTLGVDYLATLLGVKKRGGSLPGVIGTAVGLVAGLVLFNIPGMLIGCFLGALAGELVHGKDTAQAASIALGALVGYAVATAFKLAVWLVFAVVLFANIL